MKTKLTIEKEIEEEATNLCSYCGQCAQCEHPFSTCPKYIKQITKESK